MKHKLNVDQKLIVDGTTYKLIGIDTYKLINIFGKIKRWLSYTLVEIDNEKNRIWLGHGFAGDSFIKQWLTTDEKFKKNTASLPLNAEYTGIANITFEGAQGYSVPNSEIIWYDFSSKEVDFYVVERFLEQDGAFLKPGKSYPHEMKILKDVTVL